MASAQLKLRVIEGGGGDPRVAFGSVPSVLAATEADRIPRRRHRYARTRVVLAIAVSCAVHAGVVVAGMQWKASDEARAEGGSADAMVLDGVSLVLLDSAPSAASDSAENLPEAEPVQSATAVQMAEAEEVAAVPETAAAPVTEAATTPMPPETAAAPLVTDDTFAKAAAEEVVRVADAEAAPPTDEEVRPVEEKPSTASETPTASEATPAARVEEVARMLVNRPETRTAVADRPTELNPPDDVAKAIEDAPVAVAEAKAENRAVEADEPVLEIPEVAASSASGDSTAEIANDESAKIGEEDTRVAAVDVTEPPEPPRPPAAEKAKPAPEKPVSKPKPAPEPKPAPRSVERPASVAEDAAKGPQPGTAGAGGSSKDERGSASLSSYQAKLAARLRSFRSFPAAAEKQGITGTAVVTFTVNASGRVTSAKLGRSSGHAILDSAAVAMVHRASPFPPIPANIGRSSITVSAPVRFDMR